MAESPAVAIIATLDASVQERLLGLNNRHAEETSPLDGAAWRRMVARAFAATTIGDGASFLVAFDQRADYSSPNYLWFRGRLDRFVYIDRVVVDAAHRGQGLARCLYDGLFAAARAAGQDRVVCEVNLLPPNPGSDAFHARLGFVEIGRATLAGGPKTVRYLERRLD